MREQRLIQVFHRSRHSSKTRPFSNIEKGFLYSLSSFFLRFSDFDNRCAKAFFDFI